MPKLKLSFLGSPQIEHDGRNVESGASKPLALLVYLAVTGQNHSRDALGTLLWPDSDQSRARTYLRHALWTLKKELGEEWLYISRAQIGLQTDVDVWLDVKAFQAGITANHDHSAGQMCPDCLSQLQEAVALYNDNFLAGFTLPDSPAFDEWQFFQAEELRQHLATALEQLVQEFTERQEYESAIAYARRWLSLDGLHEPVHRVLMRLYALAGQQAAALRQYQECVRLLEEELGVEPEAETNALCEAIRTRQLGPPEATPPEQLPSLPIQPVAFVGRDLEQRDLQRSLQNPVCRLLTITGPGGMGKTRLALALAEASQQKFPDGVHFVSLTALQSAEDILMALGNSLGLQFDKEGGLLEQALRYLRQKHFLLVFDNFEHLLAESSILSAILESAPLVKIVVTSRERLSLSSEVVYPLAGLNFPDEERVDETDVHRYSAVELLLQRAAAVRPGLVPDAQSMIHVVRICQLVGGMPLALVLAASWLDILSFAEVADEIARGLDFLATEMRDIPDRQRSMRTVFATSWQRLSADEQQTLMGLTVFHGGFVREAAQAVTQSGPHILQKLVNKSLLVVDGNGRFDMHELLRQYIQEQLQASPAIGQQARAQHASYYASFLRNLDGLLKGDQQQEALALLETELENVRTAWHWLVQQGEWETLVYQILPALFRYCELRFKAVFLWPLLSEARKSLIASEETNTNQRLFILLTAQSAFFYTGVTNRLKVDNETRIGDRETVIEAWQLRESATDQRDLPWQILLAFFYGQLVSPEEGTAVLLKLLPDLQQENQAWQLGLAMQNLGQLYLPSEEDQAEFYLTKALDIFQRIGDGYESSITLYLIGLLFMRRQQFTEAKTHFVLAQQGFSREEDFAIHALINWKLADLYICLGKSQKALERLQQSYQLFMARGAWRSALSFLSRESFESLRYGTIERALETREACLKALAEADDPLGEPWYTWEMGEIYRVSGDLEQARKWYERAFAAFKKTQDHYDATFFNQGMAFYHRGLGNIALAQKKYERARDHLQESLNMAKASGHKWVMTYALADLGRASLLLGQQDVAQQHLVQALKLARQITNGGIAMVALANVALLYASKERWEEVNKLGVTVFNHPLTWQETKAQIEALLDDKLTLSTEQLADGRKTPWAWLDLVDQQIALLR